MCNDVANDTIRLARNPAETHKTFDNSKNFPLQPLNPAARQ